MKRPQRSTPEDRQIRREILGDWTEAVDEDALRYAQSLEDWRANQLPRRFVPRNGQLMLRLAGDLIETSTGHSIPTEACAYIWEQSLLARTSNTDLLGDSVLIGGFTLCNVHANGDVFIGCMVIPFVEMEDIARRLNFI